MRSVSWSSARTANLPSSRPFTSAVDAVRKLFYVAFIFNTPLLRAIDANRLWRSRRQRAHKSRNGTCNACDAHTRHTLCAR